MLCLPCATSAACHGMERLVDSLRAACPNAPYGCAETPPYHGRDVHIRTCPHAPRAGFAGGSMAALLEHFRAAHGWPCVDVEAKNFGVCLRGYGEVEEGEEVPFRGSPLGIEVRKGRGHGRPWWSLGRRSRGGARVRALPAAGATMEHGSLRACSALPARPSELAVTVIPNLVSSPIPSPAPPPPASSPIPPPCWPRTEGGTARSRRSHARLAVAAALLASPYLLNSSAALFGSPPPPSRSTTEAEEAKGKVILFTDEIHLVLGAGRTEGSIDARAATRWRRGWERGEEARSFGLCYPIQLSQTMTIKVRASIVIM
ncbi:hypothetical protein HU200_007934 [Digitaria exilis]|uniref:SIAH-type domain-containing protein n=1 Tax=Digitaria exilis TaxID=1010633 RepID=A0A835FNM6_9POAL|nr:hypothetical protein HU200_007934 [Digitaria exilis]